jgi:hypothetical protein
MAGMRGQGGAPCLQAPEGDWEFIHERLPSLITFSPEYCTKVITADLKKGVPGSYVIFNVRTAIFIYAAGMAERVSAHSGRKTSQLLQHCVWHPPNPLLARVQDPLRRIDLSGGVGVGAAAPSGYITGLSFAPDSPDEYDLLIGFSTGESTFSNSL